MQNSHMMKNLNFYKERSKIAISSYLCDSGSCCIFCSYHCNWVIYYDRILWDHFCWSIILPFMSILVIFSVLPEVFDFFRQLKIPFLFLTGYLVSGDPVEEICVVKSQFCLLVEFCGENLRFSPMYVILASAGLFLFTVHSTHHSKKFDISTSQFDFLVDDLWLFSALSHHVLLYGELGFLFFLDGTPWILFLHLGLSTELMKKPFLGLFTLWVGNRNLHPIFMVELWFMTFLTRMIVQVFLSLPMISKLDLDMLGSMEVGNRDFKPTM